MGTSTTNSPLSVYIASEASRPLEPEVSRQSIEAWVRGLTDSDKRQTDYDAAVKVIQDLHDLAARRGQLDIFVPRLQHLRARHAKKVSLLDRLDSAPLT